MPLFQNESKCENEFSLQFHFHVNQSHFDNNGFALRLALKQRHTGTRKSPIEIKINDTVQAFKNEYTMMHVSCTLVSVMGMYTKDYSTFQHSKGISCSQKIN